MSNHSNIDKENGNAFHCLNCIFPKETLLFDQKQAIKGPIKSPYQIRVKGNKKELISPFLCVHDRKCKLDVSFNFISAKSVTGV